MRIVLTLLLFYVCMSIKAQQQDMTEMKKAIDLMQGMYGVTFVYDSSLVTAKPQALPLTGNSLQENLKRIFDGTGIKWEIRNEYVLLCRPDHYTFSGYVCENSGETLINVTVLDLNTLKGTLSNEHGFFSITLPEGKHKFRFSYIGYQDVVKEVDLTSNYNGVIYLKESNTSLKEVVVVADLNASLRTTQTGNGGCRIRTLKHRRPCHKHIGTGLGRCLYRLQVNAPVHLQIQVGIAAAQQSELWHHICHKALAAKARLHSHHQHHGQPIRIGQHRLCRRARLNGNGRLAAPGKDLVDHCARVIVALQVESDKVRTGVSIIVNIPQRLADHQVHIKGQVAHLGQPGDHRRAKGDIGHKMPVHYIQVQQMSAPGGAFVGLCAHVGKIAGQHRR